MNLVEYPDREMMMLALADRLAGQLGDFLRRHERVSFSVPGGTTPGPVFDVLGEIDLDWSRIAVILNDERWVATDSPRSNTRLVRDRLLKGRAAAATLVPMVTDDPTPEAALPELTEGLRPHLPLMLLLAGMGEDMHVASLIPGADRLEGALSDDAPPLMALRVPGVDEPRVTLTAPVLREAMTSHLLITGQEKRRALERAADLTDAEAPVRVILDNATVHWAE
jgi:6-phosphogluconolactonase